MKTTPPSPLRHLGFLSLLATQFLGALNDNAFKVLMIIVISAWAKKQEESSFYISLANAVFIVPFIFFSPSAGVLADRLSKRSVAIATKVWEILVMALGFWAFASNNLVFLMTTLFLMGLQSTFFGPAKFGILPEMLPASSLSAANGWMQLGTMVAIIIGTAMGEPLSSAFGLGLEGAVYIFVAIAVAGTISSLFITRVPSASPKAAFDWNPFRQLYHNLKIASQNRGLFLSVWGVGYFWLIGILFQSNVFLYHQFLLSWAETSVGLLLATLAVGVAAGSVAAGKWSGGKVELGLVPIGAMGLTLFSLDLAFAHQQLWRVYGDLFLLGFSSGFIIVPLNSLIQQESPADKKGEMMATMNQMDFIGIAIGTGVFYLFTGVWGFSPQALLMVMAGFTFLALLYALHLLPFAFLRLILWTLTHSLYNIKVLGRENFPQKGPALLVCNHVSYVDPFLISAGVSRPIRFFMWRVIYNWKALNWFFRLFKMIPISPTDSPKKLAASFIEARKALEAGEVVCIFAEGAITRVGQVIGFRKGMEMILRGVDVPVIPVHLDRVWGSIFSYDGGKFIYKWPRQFPYPVTVSFGKALPSTATTHDVRQAVMELGSDAYNHRHQAHQTLTAQFLRGAKRRWFQKAMVDSTFGSLQQGQLLTAAGLMAGKFKKICSGKTQVGVLLPTGIPAAIANIALLLAGKVPVNLNYTMTPSSLDKIIDKAEIGHIITGRKMLEAIKWKEDPRMIFLEDIPKPPKVLSLLRYLFYSAAPVFVLENIIFRAGKKRVDDIATLVFTSGSTGEPKGVMLTHGNILSNAQSYVDVFQLKNEDVLLGVLPFFHCFGLTATLWFPLLAGAAVCYHRSPLEAAAIQKLIYQENITFILSTPTFLQMWLRKFDAEKIRSVKFAVVGAEKMPVSLAEECLKKFGFHCLEGYGCTELSPVVAVSVPDVHDAHEVQAGTKPGHVGRPLPGVSVKITYPDTLEEAPEETPGLLWVKGPNVMKGYWKDPEKTAQVMKDGWYNTGDIALLDKDGFLQITDRLSRFSKIGGEMVPHIKVEEKIYECAAEEDAHFAVIGLPDASKGEKLAVAYFNFKGPLDELHKKLQESDLPKLWIPAKSAFFEIAAWPVLGTGKVDMGKIKKAVEEKSRK